MLVGAWALSGGGVTLPVHPFTLLLPGIVLFVYPDFVPTQL